MNKGRPIIPENFIKDFCRKHHIKKLSVFGSYLREDFGPESDIDFLVEFDQRHIPSLFELPAWRSNCPRFSADEKWTCGPRRI